MQRFRAMLGATPAASRLFRPTPTPTAALVRPFPTLRTMLPGVPSMGVHSSQTIAPISLLAGGLSDGPRASTLVKVAVATAFGLAIYAPEANCMEGAMGQDSSSPAISSPASSQQQQPTGDAWDQRWDVRVLPPRLPASPRPILAPPIPTPRYFRADCQLSPGLTGACVDRRSGPRQPSLTRTAS